MRRDKRETFLFGSLQSDEGRRLLRQFDVDPARDDSIVLVAGGEVYLRSDAVLQIARVLGFPWHLAAVGAVIPRKWRDALYDWIASNRYGWFGRRETCRVPTASERARFLESAPVIAQSGADS